MSPASQKWSGRVGRRKRHKPLSDINVTPFVDIMLVLLIVFMVTAPLLTVGVAIDLPETKATQLDGKNEPLTVSLNREGQVFLQDNLIKLDELVPKLTAIATAGYDERIYVRGDKAVDYGAMMKVMGALSRAGFRRIALLSDIEHH